MKTTMLSLLAVFAFTATSAFAGDVWVNGYRRSNGTYVRGHYRSAPDSSRSNNYGPSTSNAQRVNPKTRDWDGDGIPNYLDTDDDNDGKLGDYDGNQYGARQGEFKLQVHHLMPARTLHEVTGSRGTFCTRNEGN
jgi:hypothetical protein